MPRQRHIPGMSSTETQAPLFRLDPAEGILTCDGRDDLVKLVQITCGRPDCRKVQYIRHADLKAWKDAPTRPCTHCWRIGRT